MKLSKIKANPNNPRVIKDDKFEKLKKSITEFPKMMELRPMVINADDIVLGGNMRLKALKELGFKDIPDEWVKRAEDLTEEEQRRFIIADNVGFGEHDWDVLANEWDIDELGEWGFDIEETEKSNAKIETVEIRPFSKTHILFSFSPEIMIDIQDYIQKIKDTEGVEYEQGSN